MTANAPGRTPLLIEALGYAGGALSIVAGLIVCWAAGLALVAPALWLARRRQRRP